MRVKIYYNGVVRDATPEEAAAYRAAMVEDGPVLPTAEERLEALEAAMLEMLGVDANG